MKPIIILGSLNMDLVVSAERAPQAGETLHGLSFSTIPGGKGANQAAAIGRLGGKVSMAGRVGNDEFGQRLVTNLTDQGVDTHLIQVDKSTPTGVAVIIVEASGENRILIVAGANGQVSTADVTQLETVFKESGLLVMQLEVPIPTVGLALEKAHQLGIPVLLNPAPASPIPNSWMPRIRYLVLNETEAQAITGSKVTSIESAQIAAQALQAQGAGAVILTLGSQGAVFASTGESWHIPAFKVKAVDTTAAGDAFIGGFALSILSQPDPQVAVRFGNAAGALAATKLGAQTSLPSFSEVEHLLTASSLG